ncbi:MAG: hypothetical protein HC849_02545 [Oscillatoriales cyanobacterium RU_3_3]|nr:hypothetical protein [Oscillatoriales cyanobacterium RU_3_3]
MIEKELESESNSNENFYKIRNSLLIEVKNFRTLVVCRLRNVNHWWNIGLTVTGVTLTAITTILGVIDSEALKNWLKFGIALTGSAAVATQSAHREFRCSWRNSQQPMTDWLVDELKLKYGVKKNLGKQWLDNKQLLPLLDGLDEVEPRLHESCVRELNEWLQGTTQPLYLVVCSLWGDIRDSSQQDIWQLSLNAVVQLKPLTEEHIQQYLISLDCTELCQMLEQDANLLELVRTPFLLNITVLSYELLSLAQWQQLSSRAQRVEYLLDKYVQYMLHREIQNRWYGKNKTPSAEQTRRWLVYLAQQLQQEYRTEFLVRKAPIYWVPTGGQTKSYEFVFSLFRELIIWLIPFIVFGIISWLIFKLSGQLILGLIVGLILYFIVVVEGNLVQRVLKIGIIISSCTAWCYLKLGGWLSDSLEPLVKQVQHFILRLIFLQDKHIHWNYARFLNYCAERLLLQRVGRRYRFIHKLLEDYFSSDPFTESD